MRRTLAVAAVAVCLTAAAAAAASKPLVPAFSQHEIKAKHRLLAYVPSFAPTGFRYYSWSFTAAPAAMHVILRNRYGIEITFTASKQTGDCAAGNEKSFQLDGNKTWWRQQGTPGSAGYEQEGWRCVKSPLNGVVIRLSATTTRPPSKFSDSGLGQVAANGRRISR